MKKHDDRDSSTVSGYCHDCKVEVVRETFWGDDAGRKAVALRVGFAHDPKHEIAWDISSYSTVYIK
jgi:hypothetical protein